MGLHGALADDEPLRDTGVGEPSAMSSSTRRSRSDSRSRGVPVAGATSRATTFVECGAAVGDPLGRVEEVAHLEHAVFQEVAEAGLAD